MYESNAQFTLGMVVMAVIITSFLYIMGIDNEPSVKDVYDSCVESGVYVFEDSKIIKCEVK